jgi:hypothetical protein
VGSTINCGTATICKKQLFTISLAEKLMIAAFRCGLDTVFVKQVGSDSRTILDKTYSGCQVE